MTGNISFMFPVIQFILIKKDKEKKNEEEDINFNHTDVYVGCLLIWYRCLSE